MLKRVLLIGSVLLGLFSGTPGCCYTTCYDRASPTTTMRWEYKTLLDKYHKEGVITRETYDKLMKAFEEEMKEKK